jgi:hypothetical protein
MSSITCPACLHSTPVLSRGGDAPVVCLRCRAPIPTELLAPAEPLPEGAEPAPTPAVHAVAPYTGTPGGTAGGFVVTVLVGTAAAALIGGFAGWLHEHVWFVLVFALVVGLAIGGLTGVGAKLGKYRNKGGAAAAGAITGFAGAFFFHYAAYQIDYANMPAEAWPGFLEFLDQRCRDGSRIGGSIELGYVGTAIYWIVEALVMLGVSAGLATWPVNYPFCAGCNAWKEKRAVGAFVIDGPRAIDAVVAGQPRAMVSPASAPDRVAIGIYGCPECGDAGGIEVEVAFTRGQGEGAVTTTVFVGYPAEAAADFEAVRRECEERGMTTK